MKKILFITFIAFLGCQKQTNKNDLSEINISQNVSSIKTTSYNVQEKFGEILKSNFLSSHEVFFNSAGKIERTIFKTNLDSEVEINFYDKNGFKIRQNSKSSNNNTYVTIYKYEKGLNIEQNKFDSLKNLYTKTKFLYDDDGNLVEEFLFDGDDGSTLHSTRYKYDEDNHLIDELNVDKNGKKIFHKTMTYDEHGNEISSTVEDNNGIISNFSNVYTYDQNENWIKKIVYRENNLSIYLEREINYTK